MNANEARCKVLHLVSILTTEESPLVAETALLENLRLEIGRMSVEAYERAIGELLDMGVLAFVLGGRGMGFDACFVRFAD
jgi:hypothetical protein